MQAVDIAEQLHLDSEIRELKLGSSIVSNSTKFHTLKYDFKPASVDDSKVATVDVGSNNTISVTVPHLDGAGTPHTVFKGSQKPYHKEYVLIFDKITGEITLEKLSANIHVKKTRAEPKQNSNTLPSNMAPVELKKSPPSGRANARTKVISGKKREPSVQLHPKQSPYQTSLHDKKSSRDTHTNSYSPIQPLCGQSTLASLPMIGGDNDDFTLSVPTISARSSIQNRISPPPVSVINTKSGTLESDSSSSSSSSDTTSSDSETETTPAQTTNGHLSSTIASPTLFMPNNLLSDDLQLSESDSDNN